MRDLGVVLDSKLQLTTHIDNIVKKAAQMLGFVKRNSKGFRPESKVILFNAFVRSVLEYASVVWNPYYAVHSQRIETIQRAFTRHLAFVSVGISHRTSYHQRLAFFGMSTLHDRRLINDLTFLHKAISGVIDCDEIRSRIKLAIPFKYPRFPISKIFYIPTCRTNLGRNSPITRICSEYNYVQSKKPDIDIFHDSLPSFKNRLLTSES